MTLALKPGENSTITHSSVTDLSIKQVIIDEEDQEESSSTLAVECPMLRKIKVGSIHEAMDEICIDSKNLQYIELERIKRLYRVRIGEGVQGIRNINMQECGVEKESTRFEFAHRQDYLQRINCNEEKWDRGEGLSENASNMIE